jgi:hypothetical protein
MKDTIETLIINEAYDLLDRAAVQFYPPEGSSGAVMKQAAIDAMAQLEQLIFEPIPELCLNCDDKPCQKLVRNLSQKANKSE